MNYSSALGTSWVNRALSIASGQGTLANSPAELGLNGQLVMCTASCIAYAGLLETDMSEAATFLGALTDSSGKSAVVAAYQRLGLSAELANATMAQNDRTPSEDRISLLATLLGG